MKTLLLFCCIVYVKANLDLQHVLGGTYVHFGEYEALVKIGNLSKPYSPLVNDDLIASRNARQLVEEARRMFKVGFYTLPPLDPYYKRIMPTFVIDNDLILLKGQIHLSNFKMTGLAKFSQNLMEIRLKTGRVDFGFRVPLVNIEVDVDAKLVFANFLPVPVRGHVSLRLQGLSVVGAVQARPVELHHRLVYELVAQHTRLHIDDVGFQFKGSQADVNQLLHSDALGSSSTAFQDLFNHLKDHIDKYAATLVLEQANKVLEGPKVDQVLAYLLPNV